MIVIRHLSLPIAAVSLLVSVAPATAEPVTNDYLPVAFRAFGTLGVAHTQGDGAAFIRDMTQPKGASNRGLFWQLDSRVGVQANAKMAENLEAVAQVVSRYRNENNFQPEVTWGFLKYTINDIAEVRAGRIGFDAFLSADSRDVGYSFLWVRPPVDYYGNLFFTYSDGGDVVFRMPVGRGRGRVKLFTGIARERSSTLLEQREWAGNISRPPIGSIQDLDGSRGEGGFIDYQDKHWIARLGVARLKINKDFPTGNMNLLGLIHNTASQAFSQNNPVLGQALTAFADDALVVNKRTTFSSLGLAYEDGPLQTQMALSRITSDSLLIAKSRAGFVSAGYRVARVTPYAVASFIKGERSSRADDLRGTAPPNLVSLTNFLLSAPLTNQHTYSIGMRYDVTKNAALKFQVDMIHNHNCSPVSLPVVSPGASCAPPRLWATTPVTWNGRANVFSAVVDFIF